MTNNKVGQGILGPLYHLIFPLFSLLLLSQNRIFVSGFERLRTNHEERFRLQTARGGRLDASGRPNRCPGASNRPPRAVFLSDPTPSPRAVGSSSLLTRFLDPSLGSAVLGLMQRISKPEANNPQNTLHFGD